MKPRGSLAIVVLTLALVLGLAAACAPPPAPTAAPTKPAAPAAPATAAPHAAPTAAAPAATRPPAAAPTATPKPAAATATPAPKIKRGGVIRTSQNADFGIGDFHLAQMIRMDTQMYAEALLEARMNERTKRFELSPVLVESWEWPDPRTIAFRLRKGVKFHDGSDWNAEVAKWNLLRMRDHPKSMIKESAESIESVEIVDDHIIKAKLKGPSASTLSLLAGSLRRPMMLSKAVVEKAGEEYLMTHVVGTGPFELMEWRQNDRQVLKRFAQYWQKGLDGQSKPYLDGIETRFIPDVSVALIELKTGHAQFLPGVAAKDIPGLKANPELVVVERPGSVSVNTVGLNAKGGPFKDNLKLRLAAQHAIDREAVAKTLGLGIGLPAKSVLFAGQTGYSDKTPRYEYDFDKARQLVKDAGHPSGVEATLSVIARQPDLPQSEVIKSMLDKVGIRTTVDSLERIAWSAKMRAFNFDATTYGISVEVDPYVLLSRRMMCGGTANFAAWCSPEYDACLQQSEQATDEDKRGDIFQRCYRISHDAAHYVYLWESSSYDAYSSKLHGWVPYLGNVNFWVDLWLDR